MELFKNVRITSHLTRIDTPFGVSMYFLEGENKAVLLDTGMGIGDLRGHVESMTSKPYTVILSHGHCDHAGGAYQFDEVYLNPTDWPLEKTHATLSHRISDVFHGPFPVPQGISEKDFVPQRTRPYLPVREGDVFDLGGIHLSFIAVPGHTRGCLVPLIEEERTAIIGDALGENTLLHFPESTGVATYLKSLEHLQDEQDRFDTVLRFHGTCTSKKQIIDDSVQLCEEIISHQDAQIPVTIHDYKGMMARKKEHPGKEGNIIYNPERIHE